MALMRPSAARETTAGIPPRRSRARLLTARALSSLVLATVLALMVVLADRLVSLWSEGRLVVAIVVLWLVLFAGLVLLSGVVRRWSDEIVGLRRTASARTPRSGREQSVADGARRAALARVDQWAAEAQDEQMPLSPVHDAPDTRI